MLTKCLQTMHYKVIQPISMQLQYKPIRYNIHQLLTDKTIIIRQYIDFQMKFKTIRYDTTLTNPLQIDKAVAYKLIQPISMQYNTRKYDTILSNCLQTSQYKVKHPIQMQYKTTRNNTHQLLTDKKINVWQYNDFEMKLKTIRYDAIHLNRLQIDKAVAYMVIQPI